MPPKTPSNKSAVSGSKKAGSNADSTPQSCPDPIYDGNSPLGEKDKVRVRGVEDNEGRCLIENCDKMRAVQFAHVVPKSLEKEKMERVEWYWNLPYRGLHLNTRWNIFNLGSSIHYMFDHSFWILVPQDEIIQIYYDSLTEITIGNTLFRHEAHRNNFPDIPNRRDHIYRLLPASRREMLPIAITRQDTHPEPTSFMAPEPRHFTTYTYPFHTFPPITSHVHPKFVILRAGLAMDSYISRDNFVFLISDPMLRQVYYIYKSWTAELPEDANVFSDNQPSSVNDDPDGDEDSNNTGFRSVHTQSQGKGTKQPETPTSGWSPVSKVEASGSEKGAEGRQRGLKHSSTTTLTEQSLELHSNQVGEEEGWTNDAIYTWSEKCRPLADAHQSTLELEQANSHHQICV